MRKATSEKDALIRFRKSESCSLAWADPAKRARRLAGQKTGRKAWSQARQLEAEITIEALDLLGQLLKEEHDA